MKSTTSFFLIVAIGVLASCNGIQSVPPIAQQSQTSTQANSLLQPLLPPGINPRASGMCTAPHYKPKAGPFIIFIANGKVKHGTFKSAPSPLTLWVLISIKKAAKPTPPPTTPPSGKPSGVPSASPPPMNQPTYFYLGEYALAKAKKMGCAYLFATQHGKPFTGSKYNSLAFGDPLIAFPKYYKEKVIASGPLSMKLSKLSATGGSGGAILKLKNGTTYDTATVKLTYRIAEP